ncbi:unnamed protein product [Alternaria alternata]
MINHAHRDRDGPWNLPQSQSDAAPSPSPADVVPLERQNQVAPSGRPSRLLRQMNEPPHTRTHRIRRRPGHALGEEAPRPRMIWYLLYPLRGTTEPPRLSTSHPIRRAFQAHGTATARHWLLSIVLTITISVLLCYQAVFQADSSAAAALRNLPKHVWTSTTEVEGERPADVVVRQVWVHGDYMNAIALPVLREAMHVQEVLINGGFDTREGATYDDQHMLARHGPGCVVAPPGEKWGWHSPLLYWDCSLSALEKDSDLLGTINAHARIRSPLNVTLRPSTVFAGKSFSNTKLRAADALVITLFDQTNSSLGDTWDSRSRLLAEKLSPDWTIFPPDGQVGRSRLYEFRFKPMTLNDDLFLAASYMVTAAYVIWRMMQLRAVKSWFGLLVTICVKVILSVDVQRIELSDSLEREDLNQSNKKNRAERQSWLGALFEGTLPLSTRFAGTVAICSIILAINWHFFDSDGKQLSLDTLRRNLTSRKRRRATDTWSPPPINQARTPADWLRIQDHNTARELFGFIKPDAPSFVARIHDPILVVAKGAYGRDRPQPPLSFMDGLRRFARGHAFPVALIVVTLIAAVTLFMNYLLWSGLPKTAEESEEDEEVTLSIKTLPTPQNLDVVHLTSCSKGHLASISLDRSTALWLHGRGGYLHTTLQTASMKPKLWPIYATAMDDGGNILALCAESGQIGLWDIPASRFLMFPKIDIRGQAPILFTFVYLKTRLDVEKLYLVIVSRDGHLTKLEARTGIHYTRRVSSSPIACTATYTSVHGDTSIVFVTKPGEVHILPLTEDNNIMSEVVAGLDPGPPPGSNPAKIRCIEAVPSLGLIFALRDEEAEIFDFTSRALVHAFQIGHIKPHSFRVLYPMRRTCQCGAPTVNSLAVAYTELDTGHMIMQNFSLDDNTSSQICLGKPLDREKHRCRGLDQAKEAVHYVEPAGVWESTDALSVVGVRRYAQSPTPSSTASGADDGNQGVDPSALASALKQRAQIQGNLNPSKSLETSFAKGNQRSHAPGDVDTWEAWTLSSTGEFRCRPLVPDNLDGTTEGSYEDELFVAAPGPMTRLGKRSVVVGFGNTVKVITLGKESFDGLTNLQSSAMDIGLGSYKWRARKGTGRKVQ